MHAPAKPADHRGPQWTFLLALCVTLGTALIATVAVFAVRWVLRQDLAESAAAESVIRAAKLHAVAERMGGHARGFLLTGDPASYDRVTADRRAFFGEIDRLLQGEDPGTHAHLREVRALGREYDGVLDVVVGMRRSGQASEAVVRAFEDQVRPRREALDHALSRLTATEEARLESVDRSAERAASGLATTATGAAAGALLVSLALAVLLGRVFQSLRRKQAELEEAVARVEQANQDLDAFAGRIAHDLRTPLQPIMLMAERLRLSSDEKVARAAERIERGAQNANRMLEELLAFSRVGREVDGASAPAAAVIRETLEDLADRAAEADVTVETRLDETAVVACGEALFRQLVGNLASNAIKFMAGRDERRLSLELRVEGAGCVLEVRDTGPGIPCAALERVFEPFYRVPGVATPGAGLGLAIVRRIVEAHAGSVTAESTVGRGTTFRVVLPRATVVPQPEPSTPRPVRAAAASA